MLNWRCVKALQQRHYQGLPYAYPTESVFGIGCDPFNADAVDRVFALKARPRHKGMIICAASIHQLTPFLSEITATERQTLQQLWPGPHTVVVPQSVSFAWPWLIAEGQNTLALRVSAHPTVQAICRVLGPIVSTSANRSGRPPCRHSWQVRRVFPELNCLVTGAVGDLCRPTRIVDLRTGQVLRS